MFIVSTNSPVYRTFGPFETYRQAAACARVESRKARTTHKIERVSEGDAAEIAAVAAADMDDYRAMNGLTAREEFPDAAQIDDVVQPYADFLLDLEHFDWFYSFSDDHRVYRRGEAAREALEAKATSLGELGITMLADWRAYIYSGEAWGTEKLAMPTLEDYDIPA